MQTHPIVQKLTHIPDFLLGPQGTIEELGVVLLVAGAVGSFVVARRKAAPAAREPFLVRARFELLAAAFFAAYVVFPYSINFGAYLYVRFLAPAYVIALVALARDVPASRAAAILSATVPLAWLFIVLPHFADASEERRAVDKLLSQIAEGSAVAVLGYGPRPPDGPYDPLTPGNRVLAVRGGRALHSFAEYPIAPVVVRKEARWDEPVIRVYRAPATLRPGWDLTRFRYLLLRIPEPERASLVVRALAPEARLVDAEGAWRLLESTLPQVAIDAPDARLPAPPPATIQERVTALLAAPPDRKPAR